jgi:hypothetical protein
MATGQECDRAELTRAVWAIHSGNGARDVSNPPLYIQHFCLYECRDPLNTNIKRKMLVMVNTPDELKMSLISNNIATPEQIVGCESEDINSLEERYGSVPDSYKQIMSLLGKEAGRLAFSGEFYFFMDDISRVNTNRLELLKGVLEESGLGTSVLIICSSMDGDDCFIHTNQEGSTKDSPVFICREDREIEQIFSSVWEWIEMFIEDAKKLKSFWP